MRDFALEWTGQIIMFGQISKVHGHDSFASKAEMREAAEILKAEPNIRQITYYKCSNGIMQAIGTWDRGEK